jgi:segregation and condensation protein A
MDFGIATHQARAYTVATPVYEGPLDLLLTLIERAELDITKLALAQVTDQYLQHLRQLEEQAADEVSAFLVIAARLLQIKSEVLLPRPPVREPGEEDPGEALARQLLAYKQFKNAAAFLSGQESAGLRTYLRMAPPPKIETALEMNDLSLADLVSAAQHMLDRADRRPPLATVVSPPRVTIRDRIGLIARFLRSQGRISFRRLFERKPSPLEIVVTFLAMLELIKRNRIQVHQETLFGEIDVEPLGTWDENETFELEFGE